MSELPKCPMCGNELHKTVVTHPLPEWTQGTYYSCPTPGCGYHRKLTEKEAVGYETCNCVGCM